VDKELGACSSYSAEQRRPTFLQKEAKATSQARKEATANKAAQSKRDRKGKGKARSSTSIEPRTGSTSQGTRHSKDVEPRVEVGSLLVSERGKAKPRPKVGVIRRPKESESEEEDEDEVRQSKDVEPRKGTAKGKRPVDQTRPKPRTRQSKSVHPQTNTEGDGQEEDTLRRSKDVDPRVQTDVEGQSQSTALAPVQPTETQQSMPVEPQGDNRLSSPSNIPSPPVSRKSSDEQLPQTGKSKGKEREFNSDIAGQTPDPTLPRTPSPESKFLFFTSLKHDGYYHDEFITYTFTVDVFSHTLAQTLAEQFDCNSPSPSLSFFHFL
jgi:hypothetical protein